MEVVEIKSKEDHAIRLGIVEGTSNRIQKISPNQIVKAITSEANLEILNDWLYWHDFELIS